MFDLYALKGGMLLIEHVVHDPIRSPCRRNLVLSASLSQPAVCTLSIFALMFEMMVGIDQSIREFRIMLIPRLKRMGAV